MPLIIEIPDDIAIKHGSDAIERLGQARELIETSMPRWRERQRSLPVGEKVELIGKLILQTRQFERLKASCKLSAMS